MGPVRTLKPGTKEHAIQCAYWEIAEAGGTTKTGGHVVIHAEGCDDPEPGSHHCRCGSVVLYVPEAAVAN